MGYDLTDKQKEIARQFAYYKMGILSKKKLIGIQRIEIENSADVVVKLTYNIGKQEVYTLKNMINELNMVMQKEDKEADKAYEYQKELATDNSLSVRR